MIAHCLFEQSGTFKNEFKKLGYESYDYDIQNEFGETDYVIDLFEEISLDGEFINSYSNAADAYRDTGVCQRNILQVASKTPFNDKGSIRKQAGGYIWRFEKEVV